MRIAIRNKDRLAYVVILAAVVGFVAGQLVFPPSTLASSGGEENCDWEECNEEDGTCQEGILFGLMCEEAGHGAGCWENPCF